MICTRAWAMVVAGSSVLSGDAIRPERVQTISDAVANQGADRKFCRDLDDATIAMSWGFKWKDVDGFDCHSYQMKRWCVDGALKVSDVHWHKTWGTLKDWAKPGFPDAGAVCCACGGGFKDPAYTGAGHPPPRTPFRFPGKTGLNCEGTELFKIKREDVVTDTFLDHCSAECVKRDDCRFLAFLATKECMGCGATPKYSAELRKTRPNPWLAVSMKVRVHGFSHLHEPCHAHCTEELTHTAKACNWCGTMEKGLGFEKMYCCSENKALAGSYHPSHHPCNGAIDVGMSGRDGEDHRCMVAAETGPEVTASSAGGDEGPSEGGALAPRPLGISAALITACLFSVF